MAPQTLCACNCGKPAMRGKRWARGHKPQSAYSPSERSKLSRHDRPSTPPGTRLNSLAYRADKAAEAARRSITLAPIGVGTYRELISLYRFQLERLDRERAILVTAMAAIQQLLRDKGDLAALPHEGHDGRFETRVD